MSYGAREHISYMMYIMKSNFVIRECYCSILAMIEPRYNLWIEFYRLPTIDKSVFYWISIRAVYIHLSLSAKWNSVSSLFITTVLCKKRKQNWRSLLSLVKRYISWNLLHQSANISGNFSCHFLIPLGTMHVDHGIMAHTPWWLSQWKLSNCIIQWSSF